MLNTKNMAHNWWIEVANTIANIINRVFQTLMMDKITYEKEGSQIKQSLCLWK